MPPIAPLLPRATEAVPACLAAQETTSDPLDPAAAFIPGPDTSLSTDSNSASASTLVDADSVLTSDTSLTRTLSRISETSTESDPALARLHRTLSTSSSTGSPIDEPSMKRRSVAILTPTETTRIGDESSSGLFRMERLQSLPNDALFMHLYQAVRMVLAVKEAMWDELVKRVDANDRSLRLHGWEDTDYDERSSRDRFDALVDRYYGDMQVRMSLWHSLVKAGWPYPRRELLSPVEFAEEEKLRQAILEARRNATEQEFAIPTRSIRLLLGVKCT